MGKSSTEIEHDLARKREAISNRISGLEERVKDDLSTTKARVRERASNAADTLNEKARDTVGTSAGSETAVAQHPKGLVLGSMGAGFVLGLLTGREKHAGTAKHMDHPLGESKAHWPSIPLMGKAKDAASNLAEEAKDAATTGRGKDVPGNVTGSAIGVVQGWVLSQASDMLEAVVDGISSSQTKAEREASKLFDGHSTAPEEALPAVSGSAHVGYEETDGEAPRPLERAASRMRERV